MWPMSFRNLHEKLLYGTAKSFLYYTLLSKVSAFESSEPSTLWRHHWRIANWSSRRSLVFSLACSVALLDCPWHSRECCRRYGNRHTHKNKAIFILAHLINLEAELITRHGSKGSPRHLRVIMSLQGLCADFQFYGTWSLTEFTGFVSLLLSSFRCFQKVGKNLLIKCDCLRDLEQTEI